MKQNINISLILIGNELLSGDIVDKNGHYFLNKIEGTNLKPISVRYISDNLDEIVNTVKFEMSRSRLVICSGGLGPTSDDLTMLAISKALAAELIVNKESLNRLKQKYQSRGRELNQNSYSQVEFPKGAEILINDVGTADACIVNHELENGEVSSVACLPGVPLEFRYILDNPLWSWMSENLDIENIFNFFNFRIFGLPESEVGTIIDKNSLVKEDISIAYRPQFPELLICLKSSTLSKADLKQEGYNIIDALGPEYIFTHDRNERLPSMISELLKSKNLKISFAESCTGGLLSSEITKIPNCSSYFVGSVVSYSNDMKNSFLDIPKHLIEAKGAVSPECAQYMADGIMHKTGSDIGISITGIAGPDGGTKEKETGTIYIGLSSKDLRKTFNYKLPWDRNRNQQYSAWMAMDIVRRKILNLPL